MRVTENTYQGPGASMMKPGMSSQELNDIIRSVRPPAPVPGNRPPAEENLGVSSTGASWLRMPNGMKIPVHKSQLGPTPEDNIRQLRDKPDPQRQTRAIARTDMAPLPGPAPDASLPPPQFLLVPIRSGGMTSWDRVPNPAFGQAFGMEWNGKEWVQKDPNADLSRQAMEMELEARRQEMELQRQKFARESGGAPELKAWLANRLGSGR
jgi:hypothetical protein